MAAFVASPYRMTVPSGVVMSKRILFVLTSQADLGASGVKTGSWLEELAASYYTLVDAGHRVEFASPRGGDAPLDPASFEAPWITDAGHRFRADRGAMQRVQTTPSLDAIDPAAYDAVYFIGGAGTVYDFPDNPRIGALLGALDKSGKPIAGVCHGVASLLNAVDGRPFAAGRALTSISDAEDAAAGYDKLLPMMPEQPLKKAGARYSAAAPFEAHVVEDGNLITGQNPASAPLVAQKLLARLA
jgi:putative intracellular protease/amidase